MKDTEALERAARLSQMGIAIRSAELRATSNAYIKFKENNGNRAMRRAAKRATRRRGQ